MRTMPREEISRCGCSADHSKRLLSFSFALNPSVSLSLPLFKRVKYFFSFHSSLKMTSLASSRLPSNSPQDVSPWCCVAERPNCPKRTAHDREMISRLLAPFFFFFFYSCGFESIPRYWVAAWLTCQRVKNSRAVTTFSIEHYVTDCRI